MKPPHTLLLIDDDTLFCQSVAMFFKTRQVTVKTAHSCEEGLSIFKKMRPKLILLDEKLPDGYGSELCESLTAIDEYIKIIFITAYPSFDHAVEALRNGAHDYLSKPMALEELELAVNRTFRTSDLEQIEEIKAFHDRVESDRTRPVGIDSGLADLKPLIQKAASSQMPVLITGETGTGKNVIAKAIHYTNHQPSRAFVQTNCAALPENLIESELFGFEKGAFTGAEKTRKGLFEMADRGTLFLDEIGELPQHLQAKLLSVLDDGSFRRIGGKVTLRVNVRVIAATNIDLEKEIAAKTFRQDLYYRLSVLRIHLPPLRDRLEDIAPLCQHFMKKRVPEHSLLLSQEEIETLCRYNWPGNIRELKNVIERAIILRSGFNIQPSIFLKSPQSSTLPEQSVPLIVNNNNECLNDAFQTLSALEKKHISEVLFYYNCNHTQTAKILGIARSTLLRKIKKYQIKTSVSN